MSGHDPAEPLVVFLVLGGERLRHRIGLQQLHPCDIRACDARGCRGGDLATHVDVNTVVCTELSLRRRPVQLGRIEFVQSVDCELEQLGRGGIVGGECDELSVLFFA